MTEPFEKKKRSPRRSRVEQIAALEQQLMRKKWAGAVSSLALLNAAMELVEEAHAAVGEQVTKETVDLFKTVHSRTNELRNNIEEQIPPEAR